MNDKQLSKAEIVRNAYDCGSTVKEIALSLNIPAHLIEMVLDNYDEDWRYNVNESLEDPMVLEYEQWQQNEMEA